MIAAAGEFDIPKLSLISIITISKVMLNIAVMIYWVNHEFDQNKSSGLDIMALTILLVYCAYVILSILFVRCIRSGACASKWIIINMQSVITYSDPTMTEHSKYIYGILLFIKV